MSTKLPPASWMVTKPWREEAGQKKRAEFDHEVIKCRIEKLGHEVFRVTALSNGMGNQYWLIGGGVVTVYNTGTAVPGGKISVKEEGRLERAFRRGS